MAAQDSIFLTTKANLGIADGDNSFDAEVMTLINNALDDLVDFGVGPNEGLQITGDDETWDQLAVNNVNPGRLKTWLYLKVRIVWDAPQTSFLMEAFQKQIDEAAWRMINRRDGDRWLLTRSGEGDVDAELILDGGGA